MTPIQLLSDWIDEEKALGAQNAQHAVLSTHGLTGEPHGRIVAVREITEESVLFFTQKRTRKVNEIKTHNQVALTFWFERHAREVIIEGEAHFLSAEQNAQYWASYPQWAQIRFCSYAPTSGLTIENKYLLEEKRATLERNFKGISLPCSPDYCGITIKPRRFVFYTYMLEELSDVWEYQMTEKGFLKQRLSP